VIASLFIAAALVAATPAETCRAHWDGIGQDPMARYITNDHLDLADAVKAHHALRFAIPSASRATNLDAQMPQRLKNSACYHIDLTQLQWTPADFNKVLESYPYEYNDPAAPLLVIRADWLINRIGDPRKSDTLYRLLYGGDAIPKTDADFLKFWGVSEEQQTGQRYGWIEGASQVNKKGSRLIKRHNARGLSLWVTNDARAVTSATDPAEQLLKDHKHDGRELIAQVMKTSHRGGKRSAMQVYLLADGNGKRVDEAPVDLVEDFSRTFGQAAIVTQSSCISCHSEGMKRPTLNILENMLANGVLLNAYSKEQRAAIEEFYLSDVETQIRRDNENYAAFVLTCNGLTTSQNADNYREVIEAYERPLAVKDAARELSCTVEELKLAAGYASLNKIIIGNQFARMIQDAGAMPRSQWEEDYRKVAELLKVWRAKKTAQQ